jgi:PAS domain S-box-containing protein
MNDFDNNSINIADNDERNSILVVDDEKMNLEFLRKTLCPEHKVSVTKSGASALEMANNYMPDLILLDILMPGMNGFEVLEKLKASEKTKKIPVIIMTGLTNKKDEERVLSLGAADFLNKPLDENIVKLRVRNQLQIIKQIIIIEKNAEKMRNDLTFIETIVSNYKGVIWSVNNENVITSFNGQFLKTIGVGPSALIGKNIQVARDKGRHPDIIDNIEKTFREGPQDWYSEVDGIVFRSQTMLMRDKDGNVTGLVGSSDDVTEIIRLKKVAETANQTKSAFLAKMSHEIRTPLNAVLGISEIELQDKSLPQNVKEAFKRIYNSGDLLLGIINDILDMSKIEAGKLELHYGEYDVPSIINDTVFLTIIKYENKPIEFLLDVDENLPSSLYGDELRIKQILNNLLSNAFKYTKKGEVELKIKAEYINNDLTLVFRVRDTGQGMTTEQIGKLYDEYSRFNTDINKFTEGTGLGMSITQNLIHMMNGEILVESETGKGSLFTVRIPQGNTGAAAIGKEVAEKLKQFRSYLEAKTKNVQIVRGLMPSGKVLVVDDIDMNLFVARGMLSPYELQIDTALGGSEAIEKIKNNEYDIVFMDHMMPGMDGIEATQEIRKLGGEYDKLPVIALTANAVSGMKEMFLANRFNGFLSKPISPHELNEILNEWMPPEKITKRASQPSASEQTETTDADKSNDSFMDAVGKISEINKEVGLNQLLGDKNIYRNTLDQFHKKIIPECNHMSASLDTDDINNFTISVHAMKSMLAITGAMELSEEAYKLEMASKNNEEVHFCKQNFPEFKEKLLSLHDKLSVIFPDTEEKKTGDADNLQKNAEKTLSAEGKPQTGKVLIVDDMEMLLYVMKEKLTVYGLQVDTALSGSEAIEKIKYDAYDIVFMDHMMPEIDGIEATHEIRKLGGKYEKLPVIALTANADSGVEEMFSANGLNGYLAKPVVKQKLEEVLKEFLPQAVQL